MGHPRHPRHPLRTAISKYCDIGSSVSDHLKIFDTLPETFVLKTGFFNGQRPCRHKFEQFLAFILPVSRHDAVKMGSKLVLKCFSHVKETKVTKYKTTSSVIEYYRQYIIICFRNSTCTCRLYHSTNQYSPPPFGYEMRVRKGRRRMNNITG